MNEPRATLPAPFVTKFVQLLDDTIRWCEPRVNIADPRGCLRSLELPVDVFAENREGVVTSVTYHRNLLLWRRAFPDAAWEERGNLEPPSPARTAENLRRGRLLVFRQEVNLYHGLEAEETGHYIDVNNIPPWDTWVAFVSENMLGNKYGPGLVSWVPPEFVDAVQQGIDVSAEECFHWLGRDPSALLDLVEELLRAR